jgi:hypothetical protein
MQKLVSFDELISFKEPAGFNEVDPSGSEPAPAPPTPLRAAHFHLLSSRNSSQQSEEVPEESKPPQLEVLRELPGILKISPEENVLPHPALSAGVPRGAITEVARATGTGRTSFILDLLAANPASRCAWIEEEITFYPPVLHLHGIDPQQVFFVEAGNDLLWATQQILRSQLFPIVVLEKGRSLLTENDLRRLQILAHQGNTALMLLGPKRAAQGSWIFKRRA